MDYKRLILNRKSTREYKKLTVKKQALTELEEYFNLCKKLVIGIEIELIIKGKEVYNKLEGKAGYNRFMIEAPNYLIMLSDKKEHYIENAGYIGENILLKALELGIDSCWITFKDSDEIKKHLDIQSNKEVVAIIALGYSKKTSKVVNIPKVGENETKTKIDIIPDNTSYRKPVEELVYVGKWGENATVEFLENRALLDAFHYARLAPSTLNRQPWRFIIDENIVVLAIRDDENTGTYEEKIDAGIAMLYFETIMDSTLADITWTLDKPQKDYDIPSNYIIVGYCNI